MWFSLHSLPLMNHQLTQPTHIIRPSIHTGNTQHHHPQIPFNPSDNSVNSKKCNMWRRFSLSNTDPAAATSSSSNAPPPPPPTPTTEVPKSATSLANAQSAAAAKKDVMTTQKEHDLPTTRPAGFGQRRRSSLLERLTRESTKEGNYHSELDSCSEQNMIHYIP